MARASRAGNYIGCFLFGFIVGALFVMFMRGTAWSHEFYSAACCSGRDCAVALPGDVTWTPAGYRVQSTGETIPASDPRIQHSPPGEPGYRLCVPPYDAKVRCLYIPEPES